MTAIFFIINAIETIILSVYLFTTGSAPSEQVLFGLSTYRLVLVALFSFLSMAMLFMAFGCIKRNSVFDKRIARLVNNEGGAWRLLAAGIFVFAATSLLFITDANQFKDFKNIYNQLQPILSWLFLISGQLILALIIKISFRFNPLHKEPEANIRKEISVLLLIFAVSVALKLLFVTPSAYGPVNGDEMEYYSLAYYLGQGNIFRAEDAIHYPPLYPLFIIPALSFGSYSFDLIKILNVLLSSSIVFPVYLSARQYLDSRKSVWVAIVSCLLPFHLVFPRRIQSENLYFPLFFWSLYMVLTKPKRSKFRWHWDILSGFSLGLLYLTRYITLAILPAFFLGWILKTIDPQAKNLGITKKKAGRFFAFSCAIILVFIPWIMAGLTQGYSVMDMLGFFSTIEGDVSSQLTFTRLMIWVLIYCAYLVLMAAPVLPYLLLSIRQFFTRKPDEKIRNWFIVTVAMLAFYSAAVVRHSWRVKYNSEMPMKIMGRYFIFFIPIFLITAIMAVAKLENQDKLSKKQVILLTFSSSILIIISYLTIIKKSIVLINAEAINMLGSVDGYSITLLGWRFFVILGLTFGLITVFLIRRNTKYAWTALTLGAMVFYLSSLPAYSRDLQEQQGLAQAGMQATEKILEAYPQDYQTKDIHFLLPNTLTSRESQLIYMSIQARGVYHLIPGTYDVSRPISGISAGTIILWDANAEWISSVEADQWIEIDNPSFRLINY